MRSVLWVLSLVMTGLIPAATAVQAQAVPAGVGSTVRISLQGESEPIQGTIVSQSNGAWTVADVSGERTTFAADDVAKAEVRRSRNHWLTGALVGGGAGLILGLAVASEDDNCDEDFTGLCDAVVGSTKTATVIWLPIVGAGAGALVGSLIRTPRWVPAVLPRGPNLATSSLALSWRIPLGGKR